MEHLLQDRIIKIIEENQNSSVSEILSINEFTTCSRNWDITYIDSFGKARGFCLTEEMLNDNSQAIIKEIKKDVEILKKKAESAENALHSLALKAIGFEFNHITKELTIFTNDGTVTI